MAGQPTILLPPQPPLRLADILRVTTPHGVALAAAQDLPEAQALAARLMAHKVAELDVYLRVQAVQPAAVMIAKEEGRITAVTAMLFLRPAAVDQFAQDAFEALDPANDLLTVEGESPAAVYSWGVAAATKSGGAAVLGSGVAIREELFPHITALTRAVTGAGRHVALTRYGYRPLRRDDDDLLVAEFPPAVATEQAA
ncbi:hypothetical protein ACO2Q3_02130 [Caulobacter sp. KR2-114]|uniref:hypothetical protein n=1 Tax=Caulobacter sp. KR2-114 TaxID=3400912 RepID=UPI003BFE41BE